MTFSISRIQSFLNRHSAYFFVPLSLQLLNEESPICRQMVAAAIKVLLRRVSGIGKGSLGNKLA